MTQRQTFWRQNSLAKGQVSWQSMYGTAPGMCRVFLGRATSPMTTVSEFQSELQSQLRQAELRGASHIEINSGQLHRAIGGYPGIRHQMPSCCDAMYNEQKSGDEVIARPPKGKGASLTIRYMLPRHR